MVLKTPPQFFNLLSRTTFLTLLCVVAGTLFSNAQNCSSELTVKKNRSYKAVTSQGAVYSLLLKNTGNSKATYTLSAEQMSQSCGNKTLVSSKPNATVNVSFLDNSYAVNKRGTVVVAPNAVLEFKVRVLAPEGTPVSTWGCVQINAVAEGCRSNNGSSTVLSAWIQDPTDQE